MSDEPGHETPTPAPATGGKPAQRSWSDHANEVGQYAGEVAGRAGAAAKVGLRRLVGVIGVVLLLVIVYFVGAAFIPRWWGNTVGNWVDNSFSRGIGYGLAFGLVCTAVPVWLLAYGLKQIRNHPAVSAVCGFLAVVVAIPNLMTASIAMGISGAAHAGQRSMDVRAPGFRGATLWGSIIGAIVALAVVIAIVVWTRGREQRKIQKAADKAAAKQAKADAKAAARAEKRGGA
ncbi:hypothetical protein [Tsukamurella sp. NPDC003166]|uniref:hypothetical protein n=1 Tax=Tsukamurella sp. NPDC003166 TaxID=3154444 RepID=UPI0033BF3F3D